MLTHRDVNPYARKITPEYLAKKVLKSTSFIELFDAYVYSSKYWFNYFLNLNQKTFNRV